MTTRWDWCKLSGSARLPSVAEAALMLDADLAELSRLVDAHERFVHVTHVNPDADGVGSAVAMSRWLRGQGKRSVVVVPSAVPPALGFMHDPGEVEVGTAEEWTPWPADAVTFLYDVSALRRFAQLAPALGAASGPLVLVDHHDAAGDLDCLSFVDVEAGATAQIVQLLLEELGVELDHALALPLYVGLISDTGCFNYGKTSPETHEAAARLLQAGVDPLDVHGRLEGNHEVAALRAAGRAMTELQLDAQDRRIASLVLRDELIAEAGPGGLESLDLVNRTISIAGVHAGVLIQPVADGSSRLSFRSKGTVSVVETARSLGGGGHRNAAGASCDAAPEAAREEAVSRLREEVVRQLGRPSDDPDGP